MPEIRINNLQPSSPYLLAIRATAGEEVSEWSLLFEFITSGDTTAPKAPSNFVATSAGRDTNLTWDKPTENENGTPLRDFHSYVMVISDPVSGKSVTREIYDTKFTFSHWDNVIAFGTFARTVNYDLRSRDRTGNLSTIPALATTVKPLPNPVTNLVFAMKGNEFVATWDKPTGEVADYQITVTGGSFTRLFTSTTNSWSMTFEQVQGFFGGAVRTLSISVRTRDLSDQLSTAVTASVTDSKPSAPTAVTAAAVGDSFEMSWTAPATNEDGTPFTDLNGYLVRAVNGGVTGEFLVAGTRFSFPFELNKATFGGIRSSIAFSVAARDSAGQVGAFGVTTPSVTTNAAPVAPTGVTASAGPDSILVNWTAPASDDVAYYEIYTSTASTGGTPTFQGRVGVGTTSYRIQTVAYSADHWVSVKAFDAFDSASPESTRVNGGRPVSPFTLDSIPPAQATSVTLSQLTNRSPLLPSAVQLSWTAPADSDLAGYHVRYARSDDGSTVSNRVWEYIDLPPTATSPHVITGLVSEKSYVAQMQPFDETFNTPVWPTAEAGPALSSKSNIVPAEFQSSISIITGGSLRSGNYAAYVSPTNKGAGWLLTETGLNLNSGFVNADVITAGTLKSSLNVTHDGTTQPAWSLNVAGNMSVNDAQVRGKIVVGNSAATNNANVSIASHNYGLTGPQWAIKGDGTFDIKSGTGARVQLSSAGLYGHNGSIETFNLTTAGALSLDGTIRASGGNFYGTVSVSGKLEVYGGDAYVIVRRGGTGNWVMLDGRSSNDWAIDSATGKFRVDYDGNVTASNVSLSGYINANLGGAVGGFNINNTDGLYAGSGGTRVQMKPGAGFWSGADAQGNASWYVRQDGYMWATYGYIGGWYINSNGTMTSSGGSITLNGASGTISGISVSAENLTGSTISGKNVYAGEISTNWNGNNRITMGPSNTGYAGYPALQFRDGNNSSSGISGAGNQLYMYSSDGSSTRIHMDAGAGTGGQINFWTWGGVRMTVTGNGVNLSSDTYLSLGQATRQMINLWGTTYGIGVQSSTQYFRSDGGFAWFRGGGHTDTQNDAGGGTRTARLDSNGGFFTAGGITSTGDIAAGSTGAYSVYGVNRLTAPSSLRYKSDISTVELSALDVIDRLRPVTYVYNDEREKGVEKVHAGFIAEEVEQIDELKHLVGYRDGEVDHFDYQSMHSYMVKAMQELRAEVADLRSQLTRNNP